MNPNQKPSSDAPRRRRPAQTTRRVIVPAVSAVALAGLTGACTYPEPGTPEARALDLLLRHDQQGDGAVDSEDVISLLDLQFALPDDEIDELLLLLAEFFDIDIPDALPGPPPSEAPAEPAPPPPPAEPASPTTADPATPATAGDAGDADGPRPRDTRRTGGGHTRRAGRGWRHRSRGQRGRAGSTCPSRTRPGART